MLDFASFGVRGDRGELEREQTRHNGAPKGTSMAADALSDVLKTVRMTGAIFFSVTAKEPWVAEQLSRETVLPMILPGAEHMMAFHIVSEGRCFAHVIGGEAIELSAGEVVVFTRGDPHVMSSSPGMRAEMARTAENDDLAAAQLPFTACFGAEGPPTAKVVCGFLACDARPFNPLLDNLPAVLTAGGSERNSMPWLAELVRVAMDEAANKRAGGESVLAKLTELMFIEVVRQYLERLPDDQAGWLAGLRDQFVGKALSLMHANPSHNWQLEELARRVGSSRSEFAGRFAALVGLPPMQYLARWRMQVASGLLRDKVNIAAVAAEVGYGSEASFSRAFKKIVGASPSNWRNGQERLAA